MRLLPKSDSKPLGLTWVACPPSVVITGLVQALGEQARVHFGTGPPGKSLPPPYSTRVAKQTSRRALIATER